MIPHARSQRLRTPRVLAVTLSPASRRYLDALTAGVDADPATLGALIDAAIRVLASENGRWRQQRQMQVVRARREPTPVLTLVPPAPPSLPTTGEKGQGT